MHFSYHFFIFCVGTKAKTLSKIDDRRKFSHLTFKVYGRNDLNTALKRRVIVKLLSDWSRQSKTAENESRILLVKTNNA